MTERENSAAVPDSAQEIRTDRDGMELALREARRALAEDEVPVGAVLVRGGEVIAAAHNRREATADPTAHAEMLCIREGAARLGDWRLRDCTLYVTLEPCPMCAGAMLMSQLQRCVWAAPDPEKGCCGSVYDLPADPALHGGTLWRGHVSETEAAGLLRSFFARRREQSGPDSGA